MVKYGERAEVNVNTRNEALAVKSVEELQKSTADLTLKYNDDINGVDILSEVESLKCQCSAIVEDVQSASSVDLLNAIHISGLRKVYPNCCYM